MQKKQKTAKHPPTFCRHCSRYRCKQPSHELTLTPAQSVTLHTMKQPSHCVLTPCPFAECQTDCELVANTDRQNETVLQQDSGPVFLYLLLCTMTLKLNFISSNVSNMLSPYTPQYTQQLSNAIKLTAASGSISCCVKVQVHRTHCR